MLILASKSQIRQHLLKNVGVVFESISANIDEDLMKAALISENAKPRDIADALAEAKARKISLKHPAALVLGSDQVLEFDGNILSKPADQQTLIDQLTALQGQTHRLYSAVVFYQNGEPQSRFVARVQMQMRALSQEFISNYVQKNWQELRHCVGGYQFEGEGAQLFADYRGDYFSILGLPLLFVLDFLRQRGELPK